MSFHILHIFTHNTYLYKRQGRLIRVVKDNPDEKEQSLPIENIKAIIIAAKGVILSSSLQGALLENDTIILHCNEKYKPVGITHSLFRTTNKRLIYAQTNPHNKTKIKIFKEIIKTKILNQKEVLDFVNLDTQKIQDIINSQNFDVSDEALAAKVYFSMYFKMFGLFKECRAHKDEGNLNAYLNYGYAVLNSLIFRSIIVHGLLAHIGLHHKIKYNSWPLVYDLMEPLRPVVDALTYLYIQKYKFLDILNLKLYAKYVGNSLRDFRIPHKRYSLKLVDAIDFYVRAVANAIETQSINNLWIPFVPKVQYETQLSAKI